MTGRLDAQTRAYAAEALKAGHAARNAGHARSANPFVVSEELTDLERARRAAQANAWDRGWDLSNMCSTAVPVLRDRGPNALRESGDHGTR